MTPHVLTDDEIDDLRDIYRDDGDGRGSQCAHAAAARRLLVVVEAMRKVIDDLPRCAGEVLGGSGGHTKHGLCDRAALWWFPSDMFAYCDEHLPRTFEKHKDYYEAPWTEALAAFEQARVRS